MTRASLCPQNGSPTIIKIPPIFNRSLGERRGRGALGSVSSWSRNSSRTNYHCFSHRKGSFRSHRHKKEGERKGRKREKNNKGAKSITQTRPWFLSSFPASQFSRPTDRPTDRPRGDRAPCDRGRKKGTGGGGATNFFSSLHQVSRKQGEEEVRETCDPFGEKEQEQGGKGMELASAARFSGHGPQQYYLPSSFSLSLLIRVFPPFFCRNALWRTPFRALLLVMMWLKYEALENSRLSPTQCGFPGQVLATVRGSEVWLFKCKRARWRERELERLSTRKNGGTPREHKRIPRTERDKTKK